MHDGAPDHNILLPALDIIYDFAAEWYRPISDIACRKGCATCCTDQVTVTELEAARIVTSLLQSSLDLSGTTPPPATARLTTNEFAQACLLCIDEKQNDFPESPGCCPFLSKSKECTIYSDRPLMCRLFISMSPCADGGEATLPEEVFLVQIILQQLTEHLANGLRWGNLTSMLAYCGKTSGGYETNLRYCRKIPGFPLAHKEKISLEHHLRPLFRKLIEAAMLPEEFSLDFPGE